MSQRGKSLNFSEEEVEDLADMSYSDGRTFGLLSLLSPFIDFQHHKFHIDHVFPHSRFKRARLLEEGIKESSIDKYIDCANRIGNLQLLDGPVNLEKRDQMPLDWMEKTHPDAESLRHYSERYWLTGIPRKISGFLEFYEMRRSRMQKQISKLVNTV